MYISFSADVNFVAAHLLIYGSILPPKNIHKRDNIFIIFLISHLYIYNLPLNGWKEASSMNSVCSIT